MNKSLLNPGQARIADSANVRLSSMRKAVLLANKKAENMRLEEKFRKQFGINQLEARVSSARKKLDLLERILCEKEDNMTRAMCAERAKIEERYASALLAEGNETATRSLQFLALTLPEEVRKELKFEETVKFITAAKIDVSEQEEK